MMHAPIPESQMIDNAFVELQQVTHTYGRGEKQVRALDATDLRIEKATSLRWSAPPAVANRPSSSW